jgi:NAD(P)-dependent dehydrogenase (short-subunit alcohol dehydrogenase family)
LDKTKDMINIKGKTALITGSSRGIGQQIALGLAQLGCHVILHGRKPESTQESLKLLESFPVDKHQVFGELAEEEQVKGLIRQIDDLELQVDILYNNAAVMKDYHSNFWTHTREEWIQTYKVNVIAMYELCAAFIPKMLDRDFGRVVNLTSRIMHKPELAPYGASKWAVDKLTDDIASKLIGTNVRINYIDPGWIKTDMGGINAEHAPEDVLPGILAPALIEKDGPNGMFFEASKRT